MILPRLNRILLPAAGILLAVGALAAVVLLSQTHATPPQEFIDLADHCRTFTSVKAWVGASGRSMQIHALDDGRIGADVSGGVRYAWDGTTLWYDTHSFEPRPVDGAAPFIEDLWSECRSGFANSTWTDVTDQRAGLGGGKLYGAKKWARLDLPFAWAMGLEIYVGVVPNSGQVQRIVYGIPGVEWKGNNVTEIAWNGTFPLQALDKETPMFAPPLHPEALIPTNPVGMEGPNAFADIDDVLGTGAP